MSVSQKYSKGVSLRRAKLEVCPLSNPCIKRCVKRCVEQRGPREEMKRPVKPRGEKEALRKGVPQDKLHSFFLVDERLAQCFVQGLACSLVAFTACNIAPVQSDSTAAPVLADRLRGRINQCHPGPLAEVPMAAPPSSGR